MLRTLCTTALLASAAVAQTWTECNPLNVTCPPEPALGMTYSTTFNKSMVQMDPTLYNITAGSKLISFGNDGAALALSKKGDSIEILTRFYIMWGQFEIIFKASHGAGIISTAILLSANLDEIDWEIIGSSSNNVSNNWFGHGDHTQRNAEYPLLSNPADDFHNYTVDWNQDQLQYILDGKVVRTVKYAASGQYPQTPSYIRFGVWPAGDSEQKGTREWSGVTDGVDWSQGPYVMTVKSLRIKDGTANATQYTYGDKTGDYKSIKVDLGVSEAAKNINQPTKSQQAVQSWNNLSTPAKIGIACGVAGAVAIGTIAFCIYCMMQRKKGREEKKVADKAWEAHESELMEYRRKMQKGGFAISHTDYYAGHPPPLPNKF